MYGINSYVGVITIFQMHFQIHTVIYYITSYIYLLLHSIMKIGPPFFFFWNLFVRANFKVIQNPADQNRLAINAQT